MKKTILFIFFGVLIASSSIILNATGIYKVTQSYSDISAGIFKAKAIYMDSDNYKYALWNRYEGIHCPAEMNATPIMWPSALRIINRACDYVLSLVLPKIGISSGYSLFFTPAVIAVFSCILLSVFSFAVFRSNWAAIFAPILFAAYMPYHSQFTSARPDHHTLQILIFVIFLLNIANKSKFSWLYNSVIIAVAFWLGPLVFAPLLFLCCLGILFSKIFFQTESTYCEPVYWARTSLVAPIVMLIIWFFDFFLQGRGYFYMEALNPIWAIGLSIGSIGMAFALRDIEEKEFKIAKYIPLSILGALFVIPFFSEHMFLSRSGIISHLFKEIYELNQGDMKDLLLATPFLWIAASVGAACIPKYRTIAIISFGCSILFIIQIRWAPFSWTPVFVFAIAMVAVFQTNRNKFTAICFALVVLQTSWLFTSYVRLSHDMVTYPRMSHVPASYPIARFTMLALEIMEKDSNNAESMRVLSSPNITTYLAYYGNDIKGLGSVYWESKEQMEKAAKIFSQTDMDLVREELRKFDYIVIMPQVPVVSYHNFMEIKDTTKTLEGRLLKGDAPRFITPLINLPNPWPGISVFRVEK